jgi:NADPH:quinone reductase-like Zn-dependent oxidoreductase
MADARALWTVAPGRAEIRHAAAADPAPGWARVRALVSGISRGTESLVFHGKVPDSERQRMKAPFQEGEFPFPVKYGYAMVGAIEAGPRARIGETVLCLHPHQSCFTVREDALLPVPPTVPPERAVLAPQLETALNAIWDARPGPGDRVAVIGAGVIGCLTAHLAASLPATEVTLIDRDPSRRAGSAAGLDLALSLAAFEAEIIELSWYGSDTVPVSLGGAFHSQRLTIRASQVGHVAPSHRARWDHKKRLALALSLAADARLDALLGEQIPFDSLPERLPAVLAKPGALCTLIRYPD